MNDEIQDKIDYLHRINADFEEYTFFYSYKDMDVRCQGFKRAVENNITVFNQGKCTVFGVRMLD